MVAAGEDLGAVALDDLHAAAEGDVVAAVVVDAVVLLHLPGTRVGTAARMVAHVGSPCWCERADAEA